MDVGARIGARQEYMSVQIYPNRKKIFGSLSQTGSVGGHPAATAGPVWAWGLPPELLAVAGRPAAAEWLVASVRLLYGCQLQPAGGAADAYDNFPLFLGQQTR